ncbi:MAG: hypothetical protein J6K16_01435 [Alphaproteobacteria bacterium]|nr:hypothetical protein [Alphaproteobacteria bacterium]
MIVQILLIALLVASIFWVDNSKIYKTLFIVMNLLLLTLIYNTFIIYTADFEQSPWHENGKISYMAVVLEVLWLLCINVIFALLRKKIYISADLLFIPFLAALVMGGYLIFYLNPPYWLCVSGAVTSLVLFISILFLFVKNFDKTIRGK